MAIPSHPQRRPSGFTLIELLVVVGILALLATILLVVGSKAFKSADATRLAAQLQTIEKALDAYKTDFGTFPVTSLDQTTTPPGAADDLINEAGYRGARLLCKALVAPTPQGSTFISGAFNTNLPSQDGNDGPGFRVPPRSGVFKLNSTDPTKLEGKVYGPYLSGSSIGFGLTGPGPTVQVNTKPATYDDTSVLADANGNVILYYPAVNAQPPVSGANPEEYYFGDGAAGTLPMFRHSDNSSWYTSKATMQAVLKSAGSPKPPYLLVSSGRDGLFGPNPGDKDKANDDVTNVGQ